MEYPKFKVLVVIKDAKVYTRVVYQDTHDCMNIELGDFSVHNVDITELKQDKLFLRGSGNPHYMCIKNVHWFIMDRLKQRIENFNRTYNELSV